MIKTYAKFNPEKNRILLIAVDGKTRWITPELALAIEGWKQAAIARGAYVRLCRLETA
jgi:hypothetical protein